VFIMSFYASNLDLETCEAAFPYQMTENDDETQAFCFFAQD